MSLPRPFAPQNGSNQTSVLGVAGNAALSVTPDSSTLRIVNSGANACYVAPYSSKATAYVATATDYPVLPGTDKVIFIGDVNDRVSVFSPLGTTVQVQTGDGGV